jgi:D-glycero-D-manno-heptose 1,7-bisphosphate phosphatase
MQKAVFLDRDGVINKEKNYLYKIEDFEFIDGVIPALKYLQDKKYLLFIITNQSGINRGYYSIQDFHKLTSWMLQKLSQQNITIQEVKFCPHKPDENCNCRKPKIGMIEDILKKYDIDLKQSWLIGDKKSDIQTAYNIGIKNTIQVKSGHYFNHTIAKFVIDSLNLTNIKDIILS